MIIRIASDRNTSCTSDINNTLSLIPRKLSALTQEPLVSLLVPSYNYAGYIREALQSAREQTYAHLEIVVCDDGSSDASCDIVAEMAATDNRILLLRQENAGVAAAMNRAYRACRGEIICLLDADDRFHADKLRRVVEKMQAAPDVGFVQHAMEVIDGNGTVLRQLPEHGMHEEGWLAEKLLVRGGRWRNMPASALCFHRDVADLLFPLPAEDLRSMADAYLYMLAPLLTQVAWLPAPLSAYRLHGANLTGAQHFDEQLSRKYTDGIARVHDCIAEVIKTRRLDVPTFETRRHLTYLEHDFMRALFAGAERSVLRKKYRHLAGRIQHDDLYPAKRKVFGRWMLRIGMLLPVSLRAKWVSRVVG